MKYEKIIYSATFPTGPYANQRPGFEVSLEPGEDPIEVYKKLHEMALKCVTASFAGVQTNSDFVQYSRYEPPQEVIVSTNTQMPIINKDHEKLEIAIDNATTIEELNAAGNSVEIFPGALWPLYSKKLKELTELDK